MSTELTCSRVSFEGYTRLTKRAPIVRSRPFRKRDPPSLGRVSKSREDAVGKVDFEKAAVNRGRLHSSLISRSRKCKRIQGLFA